MYFGKYNNYYHIMFLATKDDLIMGKYLFASLFLHVPFSMTDTL